MKLVIIGYGGSGVRIADAFKKFEKKYHNKITSYVIGVDSAAASLAELKNIDDENKHQIGKYRVEGRGAGGDIEVGKDITEQATPGIVNSVTSNISRYETDAILITGSLGGATGGAGIPALTRELSDHYDDIPVYTANVLPSLSEPATFTINTAQSIQSTAKYSANTILFDNDVLGAMIPEYNDNVNADKTTHYEAFRDVNYDIARSLYLLFSADEVSPRKIDEQSIIRTTDLLDALNTGGISTLGYARKMLPMAARPGVGGFVAETISNAKNTIAKQKQNNEDDPPENDKQQDWPHPTDFVPDTLHPNATMLDTDPRRTERTVHLLVGPGRYLAPENPYHVAEWVEKQTNADRTYSGNYPVGTSRVGVVALFSGIQVPERLTEIQEIAEKAQADFEKQREPDPRNRNVFDTAKTKVPPVIE